MNVLDKLKYIPEEEYITCQRIVDFCRVNTVPYVKPDPIKYRQHYGNQFIVTNGGWNGMEAPTTLDESTNERASRVCNLRPRRQAKALWRWGSNGPIPTRCPPGLVGMSLATMSGSQRSSTSCRRNAMLKGPA